MNHSTTPAAVIRPKISILDKSLSRGKHEVSLSAYALLFSEIVQYYQSRSSTVPELQSKLHGLGWQIGARILDLTIIRDHSGSVRSSTFAASATLSSSSSSSAVGKREIKLLNVLLMIKSTLWKTLFAKEADKLEHANDDEKTYYIIEQDPIINKFISVPKDKGSLNCASFTAGIIEAVLDGCNFPAKVTAHWHKGTTFMVKFEDHVIARDKQIE